MWLAAVSYAAFIAVLAIPNDFEYPAVLTGLVLYPAMQWAFRECRVDVTQPITPLNWALLLFFFQIVVLPLLITFSGPALSTLPCLASGFSINTAVLLINVSYASFCVGYHFSAVRDRRSQAVVQAGSIPRNR